MKKAKLLSEIIIVLQIPRECFRYLARRKIGGRVRGGLTELLEILEIRVGK